MTETQVLNQFGQIMTTTEYFSCAPEEFKSELIYGELLMSPSPSRRHQSLQLHLTWLLTRWTEAKNLGEVSHDLDMILDEENHLVYRPDLLYVAKQHSDRWQQGRVFGPADLCIEILSPSDRPLVLRRKFADYERYGVTWFWIVDLEALTIEENELQKGCYRCRSEISGDGWFAPGIFPELRLRLGPLIEGKLKEAVAGEAAQLV